MKRILETKIGCDLGDRLSEICIIWPDGTGGAVKTTIAAMREFFTRPQAHVVIQVGPSSLACELAKGT